ncbi:hypothetical protein TIFTF001_007640 [Ficus carica]|uniref:Uncharacterized protein n=1 Tax=Ficus carica TaxID=3494 RepID=A0AA87ZQQ1_FICCA|nr:hypothetical protein TIFTF001_007640 [Ficus carica]
MPPSPLSPSRFCSLSPPPRLLFPATAPPYPLSPFPADATAALPSLSFSRRYRPLLPTRPSPSALSPSPTAAAALLSSQQGNLEKRRDSFASEKSNVTLLLNFLFS